MTSGSKDAGKGKGRDFKKAGKDGKGKAKRTDKRTRQKFCRFCTEKREMADYKDIARLQKFTTERGKIMPSRITGNCAKHQRELAKAIKLARAAALLPYVAD